MTPINALTAAAILSAGLFSACLADAASFDCTKAATPTEHAICDNPQLSLLDEQMTGLYETLISSGAPQATVDTVKQEQEKFLTERDQCGANFECLTNVYTARIMDLKAASGQGM